MQHVKVHKGLKRKTRCLFMQLVKVHNGLRGQTRCLAKISMNVSENLHARIVTWTLIVPGGNSHEHKKSNLLTSRVHHFLTAFKQTALSSCSSCSACFTLHRRRSSWQNPGRLPLKNQAKTKKCTCSNENFFGVACDTKQGGEKRRWFLAFLLESGGWS